MAIRWRLPLQSTDVDVDPNDARWISLYLWEQGFHEAAKFICPPCIIPPWWSEEKEDMTSVYPFVPPPDAFRADEV